jgi:hypothetical protein
MMSRRFAPLLTFALVLVLGFVGLTWWALESGGVVIAETTREDGTKRLTHIWFAEHEDAFWLEAGAPSNGWYLDALRNPQVSLEIGGVAVTGLWAPVLDRGARDWVRTLLRRKYGVRDRWVEMFVEASQSIAVRFYMTNDEADVTQD